MLEFSTKFQEIDGIKIDGKDYVLRELSGPGREEYTTLQLAATNEAGEVINMRGLNCGLVALSLFDAEGNPVPRSVIDTWPGRVTGALAEEALKLSRIGGEAEGKDPGASGEAGSGSP